MAGEKKEQCAAPSLAKSVSSALAPAGFLTDGIPAPRILFAARNISLALSIRVSRGRPFPVRILLRTSGWPFPIRASSPDQLGAFNSAGRSQWRDRGRFSRPSLTLEPVRVGSAESMAQNAPCQFLCKRQRFEVVSPIKKQPRSLPNQVAFQPWTSLWPSRHFLFRWFLPTEARRA
jgi:hypothetical protein